jgi:hypothetical protein
MPTTFTTLPSEDEVAEAREVKVTGRNKVEGYVTAYEIAKTLSSWLTESLGTETKVQGPYVYGRVKSGALAHEVINGQKLVREDVARQWMVEQFKARTNS